MAEITNHSGPKSFGTSPKKSCLELGDKTVPGPGMYNPFKHKNIPNPQWRIGKSTSRESFLDPHLKAFPSPQTYKINHSSIEKQPNKFSMPKTKNTPAKISEIPFYNTQSNPLTQTKSFSFGYTFQTTYENQLPGPGTYGSITHNAFLNKTQNHFGTSNRVPLYGQQAKNPSPANYESRQDKKSPQFSFPKDKRFHQEIIDSPGVFYQISPKKKTTIKSRIFDFKEHNRETTIFQHNQNPAPNHYNVSLKHKIPSGVIETSNRSQLANTAMLITPSPDKYTGSQVLEKANKGCSFVKEVRRLSDTDRNVPAPGTYQPMKTFSTIGGAIGKHKQKELPFVTPSACYYKPKENVTKFRGQSTIVLKGDRLDFSKTITGQIGPGSYNLRKQNHSSQLGKIGNSQRKKLQFSQLNPGVGNYNIPSTIGKLPNYFSSPKKVNQNGYSTFHQKLKFKMLQKQKLKLLENQEENLVAMDASDSKESKKHDHKQQNF